MAYDLAGRLAFRIGTIFFQVIVISSSASMPLGMLWKSGSFVLCLVGDFLPTVQCEIGIFVDFLQAILSKSTSYFLVPFFVSLSMRLAAERTC